MEHVKRAMENVVAQESLELESGLILLAIAVSGAPFLGLLGTVWGVMSTFGGIAQQGAATMAAMAPGVSARSSPPSPACWWPFPRCSATTGWSIICARSRSNSTISRRNWFRKWKRNFWRTNNCIGSMRRFSQRNSLVTLSDINITPLLDLAFVLLIIFVITTPLLEQSINLKLPHGGQTGQEIGQIRHPHGGNYQHRRITRSTGSGCRCRK